MNRTIIAALSTWALFAPVSVAQPLTDGFTYQGELQQAGSPATGEYDFQFRLFDAASGGAQLGAVVPANNLAVSNGVFTTILDFGDQFNGQRVWLQISVRPGASGGAYTTLAGRQELTVTPHAAYAMEAGSIASHTLGDAYADGRVINANSGAVAVNGTGGVTSSGAVVIGDAARSGRLTLNMETTGLRMLEANIFSTMGGRISGYEEDGTTRTWALEPDSAGEGGFLTIYGAGGSSSMFIDGNYASGNARVAMFGDTGMTFDTSATGNDSVLFPTSAISATEILDEPGVANDAINSVGTTLSTTSTYTIVSSRSITVPAPGYIIAIATMETLHSHSNGTETNLTYGISDNTTSLPSTQDLGTRLASALPSGTYLLTNGSNSVFTVGAAGTFTYSLLARMNAGAGQAFDTELTLLYVPTAYGTVDLESRGAGSGVVGPENFGGVLPRRPGLTPGDVETGRQQEIVRHLNAMAAEQTRMQQEIERLKKELEKGNE